MVGSAANHRIEEEEARLRLQIEAAARHWAEIDEAELATGFTFGDGEPVRIQIRKRGRRYDLTDRGRAVEKAGVRGRRGWLELAERVVAEEGFNVNRRGVVFVPAFEGRDLSRLAARLAETSLTLYGTLLDAEESFTLGLPREEVG